MYNPDNGLLGLVQDEPLPFLALISSISFITLGSAGCACLLSGLRRSMKRSMADSPDISVLKEDTNRGVSSTNSNMSNILGLSGPPTKNQVQAVIFFLLTTKNTLHKHSQKNLLHPLDQILISMSDLDKHAKYSQFKQYN